MIPVVDIQPREYQVRMASAASRSNNTLVILPTGLGKTLIAILVARARFGARRFLKAGGSESWRGRGMSLPQRSP